MQKREGGGGGLTKMSLAQKPKRENSGGKSGAPRGKRGRERLGGSWGKTGGKGRKRA